MKKLTLLVAIIGLQAFLPARAQSYLGEYQIQTRCTLVERDWPEESHNYVINIEPCDEQEFDFQFGLNEYGICDNIKGRNTDDDQFILPEQQFAPYDFDATCITYFSGNGNFRNDSLFMQYHIINPILDYNKGGLRDEMVDLTLVCDCKGVRLDSAVTAVETPLENPATSWRLSPQPATESVRAVCEAAETGWQSGGWRLVDAGGKALRRGTFKNGRFDVSLSATPTGLYFIEITANGTTCRLKCVKR